MASERANGRRRALLCQCICSFRERAAPAARSPPLRVLLIITIFRDQENGTARYLRRSVCASAKRLLDEIISIFPHNRTLEHVYRPSSCLPLFLSLFLLFLTLLCVKYSGPPRVAPRQTSYVVISVCPYYLMIIITLDITFLTSSDGTVSETFRRLFLIELSGLLPLENKSEQIRLSYITISKSRYVFLTTLHLHISNL